MNTNDGGPAFPHLETNSRGEPYHDHLGMSLRDWFAGQALKGLLADSYQSKARMEAMVSTHEYLALKVADAYEAADLMLKARTAL